jgi:LmbE family N-acetylglucosaminyl deacetylase
MTKKILILSPHADDEILGCGGVISKYSREGYAVNVLILTNANVGAPELFTKKKINLIRSEAKKANRLIGTKNLFFEELPALSLENFSTYQIAKIISKYVKKIKPDTVFIPSNYDIHQDHKIIFHSAKIALRPNKKISVKKIFSYEVLSETEWNEDQKAFNPNFYVELKKSDISLKIKSFYKYKSQVKKFPNPRSKEAIYCLARLRGSQVHMDYAEAFKIERIIE